MGLENELAYERETRELREENARLRSKLEKVVEMCNSIRTKSDDAGMIAVSLAILDTIDLADLDEARAEVARLRDIISPGEAAAYEEGMAALQARVAFLRDRLADAAAAEHLLTRERDEARREVEVLRSCNQGVSADMDAAEAKLAKAEAVLKLIAGDGCGMATKKDEPCHKIFVREDDWCWCCIAGQYLAAAKGE